MSAFTKLPDLVITVTLKDGLSFVVSDDDVLNQLDSAPDGEIEFATPNGVTIRCRVEHVESVSVATLLVRAPEQTSA